MERVIIATRYKFCEKLKNKNRLRMRIEWRIGFNAIFWKEIFS